MKPNAQQQRVRDENGYDRPSKSQLKRDSHALQDIGVELVALAKDRLKKLNQAELLPEDLLDAVMEARRITDHEGKRRQMQFVGKVMRKIDNNHQQALRAALDSFKRTTREEASALHNIERWRERLLKDDEALTIYMGEHPTAEVQPLRLLIRNTRKERAEQKPPRYYREMFQFLKQQQDAERRAAGEEVEDFEDDQLDDDHDE